MRGRPQNHCPPELIAVARRNGQADYEIMHGITN
jgi:hypothetical protein